MIPGQDAPLMRGNTGEAVRRLQELLNGYFAKGLEVDGDFGPATDQAVREVQALLGVRADGIWGRKSADAFESWQDELAEAIVSGLSGSLVEDEDMAEAQKQLRQLGNKRSAAAERAEALEHKLAAAFSSLGLKDEESETGLMDDIRFIRTKLAGIERDRTDTLAALD